MPDHPESWHDYGVEVEGPSIAHLADYYRALFRWSGDPRGSMRTIRKLVQSSSQTRGAVRWLIGGPKLRTSGDRKSVVWGKSASVRVDHGGRRNIKITQTKPDILNDTDNYTHTTLQIYSNHTLNN